MKKSRILNIVLTAIMLLSTILTPQMAYSVSAELNGNEEASQVEPEETPDGDTEDNVEAGDDTSGGDEAEVENVDSENAEAEADEEKAQNDSEPKTEVTGEEQNKSPPAGEVTGESANEEGTENDATKEAGNTDDGNVEEAGESTEPAAPAGRSHALVEPFAEVDANLVTNFEFVINPGSNEIIVEDGADLDLNLDDMNAVRLVYGITKPDELDIAAGDTYTIDLPTIFSNNVQGIPVNHDGVQIATYDITDGQLIITFDEAVNDFDNVEINVNITGSFNTEVFETQEEVVIEVPYSEGQSYTATLRPEEQEYEGEDRKIAGQPYVLNEDGSRTDTDRNPTHIDWTVRANDSMGSFDNATVVDDLGESLEIVEGSFTVERIQRNYNNEEIGRETINVQPTITDSGFELGLGAIEDAYDITYTTEITRPDGGGSHTINNNARIILDGDETNVSDGFEGTWSGDIPAITKDGELSDDPHVIDWVVEYNYGQENLGTVTLTDVLSEGHGEILQDTVQVYEVNPDIDGDVSDYGEPSSGAFPLELDAEGQAYYITFSSSVPVGLNDTVVNTVSDDLENPNSDDASVDVNTIPTGGKVGEQYVDEAGNPYIEWTITMNSEKIDVPSIDIRDVFNPEYLNFDTEDETLYELYQDGEEVSNFNINPYTHDEDGRTGFHLVINDAGPHTYEFVYRTYYTVAGMNEPELANNAELVFLDGDGVGIGETVGVNFDLDGPNAGIYKSGEYISTEENTQQEIEWTITFNNSNILLENPTITDGFTSGNYRYVDGSLAISSSDGIVLPYDEPTFDDNGFEL